MNENETPELEDPNGVGIAEAVSRQQYDEVVALLKATQADFAAHRRAEWHRSPTRMGPTWPQVQPNPCRLPSGPEVEPSGCQGQRVGLPHARRGRNVELVGPRAHRQGTQEHFLQATRAPARPGTRRRLPRLAVIKQFKQPLDKLCCLGILSSNRLTNTFKRMQRNACRQGPGKRSPRVPRRARDRRLPPAGPGRWSDRPARSRTPS